jgi:hypothetical protein
MLFVIDIELSEEIFFVGHIELFAKFKGIGAKNNISNKLY